MKKYKFLEHTADIKFQAFGKDINEAFENSALALTNIIYKEKIKATEKISIKIKAKDLKSLLYDFLGKILFHLEVDDFLLSNINGYF